ncbi:shootin-1 isoform X3 [Rhinatrema bivittatum]|uniref:shootin-1 isoform X3 n=1 Tax=Rhinatrema bivittatum TaxID=194408 RepID=UPI00112D5A73|nr:shootin-1 isoform X3 [Rhinatrema bivittatum]
MSRSEDEKQMELMASFKEQVGEFEELRAENMKTKDQYERMREERDEAVKKLGELNKISHMVIEEVNFMQNHLEIEKTCRESAEAFASKLNKENKTLKRISMLYMAKLGPNILTEEINIDDDSSSEPEAALDDCASLQCQQQIKELRDQIVSVQEEKKTLAIEVESLRCQLVEVMKEVNKAKQENGILTSEVLEQRKLLEKCNRVSVLAVEEYEELQVNLELEKDLRKKAESVAQEMFIEQNKLKRQSQLLLQSAAPEQQLLKALEENAKLIEKLEEERLQHQLAVKELEAQLDSAALQKEMHSLRQQLELLEEDKKELETKCQTSEANVKDLKHSVAELQKRIHQAENPVPPPPPPPPPLPPPPPNPIRSLMSMIRKKSGPNSSAMKKEKASQQDTAGETVAADLKKQAVEEMMERIKKGVHLRPVNQTIRSKAKTETSTSKPSESAVEELKGILQTLSTSSSERRLKCLDTVDNETELERILRRRKVTAEQDSTSPAGTLATAESRSMPALRSVSRAALNKKPMEAEFSTAVAAPELGINLQMKDGSTRSTLTLQSSASVECSNENRSHNEQTEPLPIVLDPASTVKTKATDPLAKATETQDQAEDERDKLLCKENPDDEKVKETNSSNC